MRIILYLGKGGVGKTTTAAATALRCAELGYKTLVTSTDIAHSLGDCYDVRLKNEPTEIRENLWAQEISVVSDIEQHWETLQKYVSTMITGNGINRVVADELSAFPGMDEIVSLLHINRQAKEKGFDRIIVDAAPTGETIRLLTMPDTFRWYAGHLAKFETGIMRFARPFAGKLLKTPSELFDALAKLDEATADLRETLSNPDISSYRVVVKPEKMVVREAERAISYLGLFNYPVDSVVVNQVLPESAQESSFYSQRYEVQAKYLRMIQNNFAPLPLWYTPYYSGEVVGVEALSNLASDCFGDADPGEIFYRGKLQELLELDNGRFLLRFPIPFASTEDVTLRKRGDEMFVTIGSFKREMILPTVLAKRKAGNGRLVDGFLEIEFLKPEA